MTHSFFSSFFTIRSLPSSSFLTRGGVELLAILLLGGVTLLSLPPAAPRLGGVKLLSLPPPDLLLLGEGDLLLLLGEGDLDLDASRRLLGRGSLESER